MPVAGGNIAEQVKYAYQDHDTEFMTIAPPVQNTWYLVFEDEDVRLLYHSIYQDNTDNVAKDIEARWTIDGTVYLEVISLGDDNQRYIYRDKYGSSGGTAGLDSGAAIKPAALEVDKRGQSFKVEVRMTAVPGAGQVLRSRCVYETLEET